MKDKEYRSLLTLAGGWLARRFIAMPGPEAWPRYAGLAGVVAVASALAQLTWSLIPLPTARDLPAPAARQPTMMGVARTVSIDDLIDSHLFGATQAQPGGVGNAPATTLNLNLHGIFALGGGRALAIIADGAASEQPYKVGDTLPGGALVHEIAQDKVILQRNGRFEALALARESVIGEAADPRGDGTGQFPSSAAELRELRARLKANPAEVAGLNAIRPVMVNGEIRGYQVAENPYMPALRAAGLMPGDVVTRVNGIPVTNQTRAAEMVDQLSNAGRIELVVERGGVATPLSIDPEH